VSLPPAPPLDLALVVPAHNDGRDLDRLLAQARSLAVFSEIVVIDDGSDPPLAPAGEGVRLLRNTRPTGSGAARNRGLAEVTAEHVLFFDADDLLTAELPRLVADLAADLATAGPFDLCLFKYADAREARAGHWGQPGWDERFWTQAGLPPRTLSAAPAAALPVLAQTANYPWNKIYRTAFLRENGIGCAPTPVHNDVPLHWLSLHAVARDGGRALVSDRICAWHEVRAQSARLTNRMGSERLQIVRALEPAARAMDESADPDWQAAFAAFTLGLFDWVAARISPAHGPALATLAETFRRERLAPWATAIAEIDPDLAARLTRVPETAEAAR
jgi:hypothetical protein